jgi:hypothetical protein
MGSKAIFKSAPNMAEHPIRSKVVNVTHLRPGL